MGRISRVLLAAILACWLAACAGRAAHRADAPPLSGAGGGSAQPAPLPPSPYAAEDSPWAGEGAERNEVGESRQAEAGAQLSPATLSPPQPAGAPPRRVRDLPPPAIGAQAAVVIDGRSGAMLFEKDAHTPRPPASTTKILTALLALERGELDAEIEVRLDDRRYWGSVMGLVNGDRFTLRDLLYGLMLPSGNDAAYVIATTIAGSEAAFADLMNQRMRALGLTENHFVNASGLGRDQGNLVSAHDLGQLARVAMANPAFARIVGARSWVARGSRVIAMTNGNPLLFNYPGADGVKIGWGGRWAGHTIVGSATRNGQRVFVVLLDTPDRLGESTALLDWAFASFSWEEP